MNKSLRTDLVREIRGSLPRFLSILIMVALGVMFLVGLRSAAPDMRTTADLHFDRQGLFDLQLYSTVGLGPSDVEALAELEGVEACAGGQALDGTLAYGKTEMVVKLHSLTAGFNTPVLVRGRLPETGEECLVDSRLAGEIQDLGARVRLTAALDGALAFDAYTVVGFVESPLYISLDRGTSTLGDGSVAGFVLLPEAGFALDYATVVYLQAEGSRALDAYGGAYRALTQALTDRAEPLLARLGAARYDFLKTDGARQLAEGEAELQEARADADRKLAQARETLAQGRTDLDAGWAALEQGRADYEAGVREGRAALDAAREALTAGRSELAEGELRLSLGRTALALRRELNQTELASARQAVAQAEARVADKRRALAEAESRSEAAQAQAEALEAGLRENLRAALTGRDPDPAYTPSALAVAMTRAALEAALAENGVREVAEAEQALAQQQAELDRARREGAAALAAAEAELAAGEAELWAGRARLEAGEAELAAGEAEYAAQAADGAKALADAEAELRAREADYAQGLLDLEAAQSEAETALARGQAELDRARARLETLAAPETYALDRNSNYGFVSYDQNAQRMTNLAKMFPVIFYLVAALVCLTTMTRMVEEERTQIGAVKALGYSTGTIAAKYLLYGAGAALLGAALGIAVGATFIPWVIFTSYDIVYDLPKLTLGLDWGLCLAATGVGLAVTLGATLWAMAATARQTPAALLRPRAPKPGKRIWLEWIGPLWRRMSFSGKVSARNLFRYKKRLYMTVIGVAGCTAMLIAGLGLHTSIFNILDVQFFDLYRYDVLVSLDAEDPEAGARVEAFLAGRAEAASWARVYTRSVTFSGEGQSVEGYLTVTADPEALEEQILLRDMDTKAPLEVPAEGALLDLKLAELLELGPGDQVRLDLGRPVALRAAALREHYVYHYAIVTAQTYAALTGETPAPNEYMIRLDGADDEAVSTLCRALMGIQGVRSAQNKSAMARSFRETLQAVDAAVLVIFLSAAALAFVVLYNLTNINVTERVRELATIKVLGFYDPEVAMYVYRENIVLTVLGVALGQLFGRYLLTFLIRTIEMDIVMFGRDPHLKDYLLSVVLSLFFAALVNLLMYFRIRKIDMVQALKSVE